MCVIYFVYVSHISDCCIFTLASKRSLDQIKLIHFIFEKILQKEILISEATS